jgi:hypothetical protein
MILPITWLGARWQTINRGGTNMKMRILTWIGFIMLVVSAAMFGCVGSKVKVIPINLKDTGKQIVKFIKSGDPKVEVTLIIIEF